MVRDVAAAIVAGDDCSSLAWHVQTGRSRRPTAACIGLDLFYRNGVDARAILSQVLSETTSRSRRDRRQLIVAASRVILDIVLRMARELKCRFE